MRTVHLVVFRKHSVRDWNGIPRPPKLRKLGGGAAEFWCWIATQSIVVAPVAIGAMYVLFKSSAFSKPLTMLSALRCELVIGTDSRFWRLCGKGETYFLQTKLKLGYLAHRARPKWMMLRELDFA